MTLVLIGSFFVFILLNIPIAISLGASSIIGLIVSGSSLDMLGATMYAAIGKFSLLAIPFFILAGIIMERAGISKRLIDFANVMVGNIRGGLAVVAVITCCFFAAISGSGPATVASLGIILIPAMVKQGYGAGMSSALLSASGSIGIIIPPSIAFVIYGVIAEVSITDMFLAGVIPGLLMGSMYILCSYYLIRNNHDIKVSDVKYSAKEKFHAFKEAFWGLMAPVIIMGGIYGGIFTPTEAAGVTVIYGVLVGLFIYKEFRIKDIMHILVDSAVSTATVMFIVACASVFAWLLTTSMIARDMSLSLLELTENKIVLLLIMNLIFLIAGCFLDTISAYYILLPVLLPIARTLNIDPIHFGIFMTVNLAIGQFTPPVGVNLYVACNIAKIKLKDIIISILPYVVAGIIGLMLITFLPQISLWLPNMLK